MMKRMKAASSRNSAVSDRQAVAFDEAVAAILQRFKLEPSIAAGSPYADLHANDVGLLVALREPERWNVRRIAQLLGAPISTVSSALDRLDGRGLVTRRHAVDDRRVVYVELTAAGQRLVTKIRAQQLEVCRAMLSRLKVQDREELIRLVAQLAQ
jgi:DNA-binding MarR family transcriptional regulator